MTSHGTAESIAMAFTRSDLLAKAMPYKTEMDEEVSQQIEPKASYAVPCKITASHSMMREFSVGSVIIIVPLRTTSQFSRCLRNCP